MMQIRSGVYRHALVVMTSVVIGVTALYGCGGEPAPTATVASAPPTTASGSTGSSGSTQANDPAAISLMQASSRAMRGLKTVHLVIKTEGGAAAANGEGDIELPYNMRLNLTTPQGPAEQIIIGSKLYMKAPGTDAYVSLPSNPAVLFMSASLMNMDAYTQYAQGATVVGDEKLGGVDSKHIKFSYDPEKVTDYFYQSQGLPTPAPSANAATTATGEIWIDSGSNYVRQYKYDVGTGADQQTTTLTLSNYDQPVSPPIVEPTNVQEMPALPTP